MQIPKRAGFGVAVSLAALLLTSLSLAQDEPPAHRGDPSDIEKPPIIYGHDYSAVCKEAHNGCAALIIDITVHQGAQFTFKGLGADLKALDCKVAEADADFENPNSPKSPSETYTAYDARIAAAKKHNADLWIDIRKKIDTHLDDIDNNGQGRNVVMEFVSSHGTAEVHEPGTIGHIDTCGRWVSFYDTVFDYLDRAKTLREVRDKASGKTCSWLAYDDSCYSGTTPKAMDEIENHAHNILHPQCNLGSDVTHSLHVAAWADIAAGTAPSDKTCKGGIDGTAGPETARVLEAIGGEAKRQTLVKGGKNYSALVKKLWTAIDAAHASYYADRGRLGDAADPQTKHEHKGY